MEANIIQLNDIELPQGPLLEMDFLLTELAWLCELCERDNWEVILRSPSVRQKHFATKHPDFTRDRLERQVPAQAFSKHKNRRNFQVIRSNVENVKEPEPLFPETTSEDIIKAYRADWKPLPPRPCGAGGENLKETMPFLVHTGFQTLIENWTPERVALFLELVKPPQSDDPLLDIYEKAVSSFMAGQKQLLNVADCHKQLVMQDDRYVCLVIPGTYADTLLRQNESLDILQAPDARLPDAIWAMLGRDSGLLSSDSAPR